MQTPIQRTEQLHLKRQATGLPRKRVGAPRSRQAGRSQLHTSFITSISQKLRRPALLGGVTGSPETGVEGEGPARQAGLLVSTDPLLKLPVDTKRRRLPSLIPVMEKLTLAWHECLNTYSTGEHMTPMVCAAHACETSP